LLVCGSLYLIGGAKRSLTGNKRDK
jgi:hypothetical protein